MGFWREREAYCEGSEVYKIAKGGKLKKLVNFLLRRQRKILGRDEY